MKILGYIILFLIVVLGVSFAILNAEPVTVHYYVGNRTLPLSLLLVLCFGVGLVLGFIVMGFKVLRLKAKNRGLRRRLRVAEQEIDNLRVIPVKE